MELDFGWTSGAEVSMIVHPMPHQAWLATPLVEILSKLIVVKVGAFNTPCTKCLKLASRRACCRMQLLFCFSSRSFCFMVC